MCLTSLPHELLVRLLHSMSAESQAALQQTCKRLNKVIKTEKALLLHQRNLSAELDNLDSNPMVVLLVLITNLDVLRWAYLHGCLYTIDLRNLFSGDPVAKYLRRYDDQLSCIALSTDRTSEQLDINGLRCIKAHNVHGKEYTALRFPNLEILSTKRHAVYDHTGVKDLTLKQNWAARTREPLLWHPGFASIVSLTIQLQNPGTLRLPLPAGFMTSQNLHMLDIHAQAVRSDPDADSLFPPRLEMLDLTILRTIPRGIFAKLPRGLQTLKISTAGCSDRAGVKEIETMDLSAYTQMRTLSMETCQLRCVREIRWPPTLRRLCLLNNCMETLGEVQFPASLRELDIRATSLNRDSITVPANCKIIRS